MRFELISFQLTSEFVAFFSDGESIICSALGLARRFVEFDEDELYSGTVIVGLVLNPFGEFEICDELTVFLGLGRIGCGMPEFLTTEEGE